MPLGRALDEDKGHGETRSGVSPGLGVGRLGALLSLHLMGLLWESFQNGGPSLLQIALQR